MIHDSTPTSRLLPARGRGPGGGTLVTVGSSTRYPFGRLLGAVMEVLPLLPAPVTIQYGCTTAQIPSDVTAVSMLSHKEFADRLTKASLIVSHAGAGTVLEAVKSGVPTLVMPRRPEFGEVADGHQLEFAVAMSHHGLVHTFEDPGGLRTLLERVDESSAAPRSDLGQAALCAAVGARVRELLESAPNPTIVLAATAGGHMTELRQLRAAYAGHPHVYVTTRDALEQDDPSPRRVFPSTDRDWHVLVHVPALVRMFWKERPGIVLSTGSGSVVPVILIAWMLGARIVHVESITRVLRPSITARIIYPFCDAFFVRWPALSARFSRATLVTVARDTALPESCPDASGWPMRLDP